VARDARPDAGPGAPQDAPWAADGFAAREPERESAPLGVALETTGEPAVDALLARLADADALPTGGHAEVYEDVPRGLRDALTALDARPGPPPPGPPG
jgi:hypothetical protein